MAHRFLVAFFAGLLLLSGCAHKQTQDMQANLEPEVWDTTQILKDLKRGRPLTEQEKRALASQGSIQFNLDVKETEEVQMFLQYFTLDKHGTMDRWLSRAEPHLPYVRAVLASYNLPSDLIVLPFIESGYSNMAYSPVGAGGMWQFMPYTARRFGLTVDWWLDERRDPYKATVAAAKYLTKLYQMFGDWNLALAAYNAGEGKVSRAMACSGQTDFFDLARDPKLLKAETRHYVPKFLAVLKIFQNLENLGFKKINWQAGPNLKEVSVPGGTDLRALAQACGLSWEQFREQNAAFRRQVSPPDQSVNAYVPVAKEQLALAYLKNPNAYPAAGYQNYAAQDGDTWWAIARRTGVPVAELRQLNASLPETLSGGVSVRVPANASGSEATALAEGPDACAPVRQAAANKPLRHRVNKGETVATIARKYNVPMRDLMAANHLRAASRLPTGSWVVIPGSSQQAAPAPSVASRGALPQPQADATETRHTVRKGESVGSIAATYGLSTNELMAANRLRSAKDIKAGRTLVIPGRKPAGKTPAPAPIQTAAATPAPVPAGGTYVVRPGDTLTAISQSHGVDMSQVMAANHLRSGDIRVGDKLVIPGGKKQPDVPPAALPAPREQASKSAPKAPATQAKAETGKPPVQAKAQTPPAPQPKAVATAAPAPSQPAPKAAPAKPTGKAVNYKVGPGETVWAIARKFNVEPASVMAWNNMKTPNSLQAGRQITIFKE